MRMLKCRLKLDMAVGWMLLWPLREKGGFYTFSSSIRHRLPRKKCVDTSKGIGAAGDVW